jgi:WD40-like Beta Propeller Repeat
MVSRKVLAVVGVMSSGILFVAMGNTPEPFVYTQAARHEDRAFTTADGRFPAGARLMLHTSAGTRALAPSLAASADAAVSFDATRVLFAGKQAKGDTWQIWEVPLAGGAPRQITSGTEDCITPFYLPDGKIVYARKKPGGFQIEIAALAGGEPLQLTYTPGDHIPDGVLRDGRVLYEAPHPRPDSQNWDIWTVYTDGSGVETYRCDHGPDRHAAAEVASGDIVFSTRGRLAKFTSARADQVELQLPPGGGPAVRHLPSEPGAAGGTRGCREIERLPARVGGAAGGASAAPVRPRQPGGGKHLVPERLRVEDRANSSGVDFGGSGVEPDGCRQGRSAGADKSRSGRVVFPPVALRAALAV